MNGQRNVDLEVFLSKVEGNFYSVRDTKILLDLPLDLTELAHLCIFTAAARSRTVAAREFHKAQWSHPLRVMEDMAQSIAKMSPAKRAELARISMPSSGPSLTHKQVKALHEAPLQSAMIPNIKSIAPQFEAMDFGLFKASEPHYFITSDHPCVWLDFVEEQIPPQYRRPLLESGTIEIAMSISPTYCLYFNRQGKAGYLAANESIVDEINRGVRSRCHQQFVSHRSDTKEYWFTPDPHV